MKNLHSRYGRRKLGPVRTRLRHCTSIGGINCIDRNCRGIEDNCEVEGGGFSSAFEVKRREEFDLWNQSCDVGRSQVLPGEEGLSPLSPVCIQISISPSQFRISTESATS
ncbi:hypothetical protein FOPG_09013 [Fusarium oxysporum f. sp. conglutinans race 2 54008]|uniref:Uncharacterized protein n=1 Tax=Fusarium oxysporum f. sp. conglutinans race 2 54008 TaxID=1089457 RepID=X0HWU3_FUSOX|nr:hypothetical protein FOPG_09013 [Fusarium oxysporum f. sp. conglutinans race 2 54008]EXL76150.1 hypothetical protein FOPG_09013 [Fusarium oxysporum f. sp. conglutinans race 2 54008]EXL76151.1 hypothetical protein FOPG_09013 [Fusarium oxysporum f. sp. conglutinans race 2 54008]